MVFFSKYFSAACGPLYVRPYRDLRGLRALYQRLRGCPDIRLCFRCFVLGALLLYFVITAQWRTVQLSALDALALNRLVDRVDEPHEYYARLFTRVKEEQKDYTRLSDELAVAEEEFERTARTTLDPLQVAIENAPLVVQRRTVRDKRARLVKATFALERLLTRRLKSCSAQLVEHDEAIWDHRGDWSDWFIRHRTALFQQQQPIREEIFQTTELLTQVRGSWTWISQDQPEAEPSVHQQQEIGQ